MQRTPSPAPRAHTPPAPLHGDNYEPFSPRRSSRVAAQRGFHHHEQTSPRPRRDVTPSASTKRPAARASLFALSPPSSPISPQQRRSPRSVRRAPLDFHPLDSDSDHVAPTPGRRFLSTMATGMLPTPAKTPRKRRIEDMSSTARVLFPSRPATIDDVVPTPRKMRKTKDLFTLESFAQHVDENIDTIQVYTDSKERVPTPGGDDENPFLSKKGKGKAKVSAAKTRKTMDSKSQKMNEAVDRDQGMVYIFRGRKVYRKFHDGPPSQGSDVEEDEALSGDEMQLRRQIGFEARRPLTRSTIKPRVLFQAEIQQRNRENGIEEEDDEEAVTDIEVPVATPSRKRSKAGVLPALEVTPPPTVRKVTRQISFESWTRVKSAHGSSSSARGTKKRSGEPLEREADKRARTRS